MTSSSMVSEPVADNWKDQFPGAGFFTDEADQPSHLETATHPETEGLFSKPRPKLNQAIWNKVAGQKPGESIESVFGYIQTFDNLINTSERLASNVWSLADDRSDQVAAETRKVLICNLQAYCDRLNLLRHYADQDGIAINEVSEADFWAFILSSPFFIFGDLVLLENGDLRIVWSEEGNGSHLGLQFLGNFMVQYVIFKQRPHSQIISRVAGRDTIAGIRTQIRTFGLDEFLEGV